MRTRNFPEKQNQRRKSVIDRLESQLKKGIKSDKETGDNIPLTDKDRVRINKELSVLRCQR